MCMATCWPGGLGLPSGASDLIIGVPMNLILSNITSQIIIRLLHPDTKRQVPSKLTSPKPIVSKSSSNKIAQNENQTLKARNTTATTTTLTADENNKNIDNIDIERADENKEDLEKGFDEDDFEISYCRLFIVFIILSIFMFLIPTLVLRVYFEKDWSVLESIYYAFISFTTIGLGKFSNLFFL